MGRQKTGGRLRGETHRNLPVAQGTMRIVYAIQGHLQAQYRRKVTFDEVTELAFKALAENLGIGEILEGESDDEEVAA